MDGIRIEKPYYDDMPDIQTLIDRYDDGILTYGEFQTKFASALSAYDQKTADELNYTVMRWVDSVN